MSETELTAERAEALARRKEALDRGRATAHANRAAKRTEPKRQAEPKRTAADAGRAGIGSNPGKAQSSTITREANPVDQVTRVPRSARDTGWADLPSHRRKSGWDYEWKTIRVLNEPVGSDVMLEVRNAGWRAEHASDWPELVEPGFASDAAIERQGQRLYGRPMQLTHEARTEDLNAAYAQQRDKTLAAASGRSAVRGEEGLTNRAGRAVPIQIDVEGLAG